MVVVAVAVMVVAVAIREPDDRCDGGEDQDQGRRDKNHAARTSGVETLDSIDGPCSNGATLL